ncbi:MAG: DNA polymerase III subunit beta [Dehalococcoidia bacterium]|nr:DNA polymerase III subunit beta [Dehalococcoidia bacterium]
MQSVKAVDHWLPTPASQQHAAALRQEAVRLAKDLAELGAELVLLFGSVVRNAVGETSDLDLLVVLATERRFVERSVWLAEVLQPTVPVDFLVYTPAEFARLRHWPFIRTALTEGQVLHPMEVPEAEGRS